MNDTKKAIWIYFLLSKEENIQSSTIFNGLGKKISLITVKRYLKELVDEDFLSVEKKGRSTEYFLTLKGKIHAPLLVEDYFKLPESKRNGQKTYNFELFESVEVLKIFTAEEIDILKNQTKLYQAKTSKISASMHKKEIERFIIELSWKSSQIEGNTYTLLDTEKLLKDGIKAIGHSQEEATMILNHKKAFEYVLELCAQKKDISEKEIFTLHEILMKDLGVEPGLRIEPVGITGSSYIPLDIPIIISEQFMKVVQSITSCTDQYSKSLVSLLAISYLQAFNDGNKRTARLLANAYLLLGSCAPLSYRNVDEELYRNSLLLFYEHNSVEAFKKIFIDQYIFSCEYYNVG